MKKILFLLLVTISSYAQTYQNPTFGTVTEKTNAEDNSATKVKVQDANGKSGWVNKSVFALSSDSPFKRAVSFGLQSGFVYYLGTTAEVSREARLYINEPATLVNSGDHGFGDYTTVTQTAGGTGVAAWASYDSRTLMNGAGAYGHLISFQARNVYNGSGAMSYFSGLEATLFHTGAGNIVNGYGVHVLTKSGSGTFTNIYGLKIENQTGGTNNFAIVTGLGKNIFGDETNINGVLLVNNKSELISAQAKTSAVSNQYSYFGKTNETSNYATLSLTQIGGASQPVRQWRFQTIEQGVSNDGALSFQAAGGRVLLGTTTDNGADKVQVTGNISGSLAPTAINHLTRKDYVDDADALKANLASPALTGTPTAPTATAGTNTTQIATTAFVLANARPYKTYLTDISQTGTSAPTLGAIVENTVGSIVWARTGTGAYTGTLVGAFTASKTVFEHSNNGFFSTSPTSIKITRTSADVITINTYSGSTLTDGLMAGLTLRVTVYN